jgi:hypothetical protein
MKTVKYIRFFIALLCLLFISVDEPFALNGVCSSCHTMHNSQNGSPMNYDNSATRNDKLLRGDCVGCHAQNTASNIVDGAPQVLHTDTTDLAGGNFGYISGSIGSGADDTKGHNIMEFANTDDTLTDPPGEDHDMNPFPDDFTCAGGGGCHGTRERGGGPTGLAAMTNAHHGNVGGQLDTADEIYNSYRFLVGVKGYENDGTYPWENRDANNHNEYFGATTPITNSGCSDCHYSISGGGTGVKSTNGTISGFCASCHGYFHFLDDPDGVGDDTTSPFIRHPTDVILPNSGEYASYTSYDVATPVGRTTVPASISNVVSPGSDVVICLSCHSSHGTNYYKMLRWDYKSATLATALSGCSKCHTDKD